MTFVPRILLRIIEGIKTQLRFIIRDIEPKGEPVNCSSSVSNGSTHYATNTNRRQSDSTKSQRRHRSFLSYKTPVAAKLPNYDYIRTATKWSSTTSRHINKWLEGVTAKTVDQTILDNLVGG